MDFRSPYQSHLETIRKGIHETYEGRISDSEIDIYLSEAQKPLASRDVTTLDLDRYFPPQDILRTFISSDKWTDTDSLGYERYAYVIAKFLLNKDTHPPICISIQAPWGEGKTSLMRIIRCLIQKLLKILSHDETVTVRALKAMLIKERTRSGTRGIPKPKEPKSLGYGVGPAVTIWFNAWKYDSTEQVWADSIVRGVAERLDANGSI